MTLVHARAGMAAFRRRASSNPHLTYSLPIIYVEISMPLFPGARATPFVPDDSSHRTGVAACVRRARGVIYGMES